MPTVATRNIFVDEEGVAWIEGTGIKIAEVVIEKHVWGLPPEEMQAAHPHWTLPHIYSALSYYHDHQAEVDEQIERDRQEIAELRAQEPNPLTRAALMGRLHHV